jgi:hypothetical protein
MVVAQYDLLKALAYCDELTPFAKAYYCATGAYMELVEHPPAGYLYGKGIMFPCANSPYPAACFRYKVAAEFSEYYGEGGKFADLVQLCAALKGKFRWGCFHGIGNAHGFLLNRTDGIGIAQICGFGTKEDQYACVDGLIERLARYFPETAMKACQWLIDWRQQVCEDGRGRQLYSMEKSFDLYPR